MPALNQQPVTSVWDAITPNLIDDFGDAAFKSWLSPLVFNGVKDGELSLSAPSNFMKDWVVAHYEQSILRHSQASDISIKKLSLNVVSKNAKSATADAGQNKKTPDTKVSVIRNNEFFSEEDFISSLDPRYTFDNFVPLIITVPINSYIPHLKQDVSALLIYITHRVTHLFYVRTNPLQNLRQPLTKQLRRQEAVVLKPQ